MKRRSHGATLAAGCLLALGNAATGAGECSPEQTDKLLASDGTADDWFGWSSGISGDTAIVGALRGNNDRGAAYLYHDDGAGNWTQTQRLTGDNAAPYGNDYGIAAAIFGDLAIVGDQRDDESGTEAGAAYVYRDDGTGNWVEVAKLLGEAPGSRFGNAVAIEGSTAVVGAYFEPASRGAAYVFRNDGGDNWIQQQKLTASDGGAWDNFGWSVAISGATVVVGATFDDDHGSNSGSAYVYRNDGGGNWVEDDKMTAADAAANDYFGSSVTIDGGTLLVGAYGTDDQGGDSGSVYAFTHVGGGNWTETQKLTASDAGALTRFGFAVSMDGDTALIGADFDDDGRGAAYVFLADVAGNWTEAHKIRPVDNAVGDSFGYSVGLSGNMVVAGAQRDDDRGSGSGSAYIYNLNCVPSLPGDANGDGMVNFADILLVLAAWGSCEGCPEDIDGNGVVDFADLLIILGNWT